jgi:hypothetical protein
MAPERYAGRSWSETDQGKIEIGKNYGLDTRIDRLLQACIPVAEMGFPRSPNLASEAPN